LNVNEAIAGFLAHRTIKGVADTTVQAYRVTLEDWRHWLAAKSIVHVQAIDIEHIRGYLLYLRTEHIPHSRNPYRPNAPQVGLSPASIERAHKVLRAFWRYLDNDGVLTEEQRGFFASERIPRPRVAQRAREYYRQDDIEALLRVCDDDPAELRHRSQAIILLLLESGMRVNELCTLTDAAVDHQRRRARIVGKGNKERWVYWHARGALALRQYVLCRTGGSGGRLFRSTTGGKLDRTAVYKMLRRLAEHAGVDLPPAPVHALRHTFAHRAVQAGVPISQLSQMMGHSDVQTTMRYLLEDPDELQRMHARIGRPLSGIALDEREAT